MKSHAHVVCTLVVTSFAIISSAFEAPALADLAPDYAPQEPTPAPTAAAPAAPTSATTPASEKPASTMTLTMPTRRLELAARVGGIGGGEVTPKDFLIGHTQAAVVARVDADYVALPFFTLGAYALVTSMGYDRYLYANQTNSDGSMSLVSLGPSIKARISLGDSIILKPGIFVGYNIESFSITEGGKTTTASGSGVDIGFTTDLAIALSDSFALTAQFGFVSQVSGSLTVDGASKSNDLAFAPQLYLSAGPEVRF